MCSISLRFGRNLFVPNGFGNRVDLVCSLTRCRSVAFAANSIQNWPRATRRRRAVTVSKFHRDSDTYKYNAFLISFASSSAAVTARFSGSFAHAFFINNFSFVDSKVNSLQRYPFDISIVSRNQLESTHGTDGLRLRSSETCPQSTRRDFSPAFSCTECAYVISHFHFLCGRLRARSGPELRMTSWTDGNVESRIGFPFIIQHIGLSQRFSLYTSIPIDTDFRCSGFWESITYGFLLELRRSPINFQLENDFAFHWIFDSLQ